MIRSLMIPLYFISLPGLSLRLAESIPALAPNLARYMAEDAIEMRTLVPTLPALGPALQTTILTGVLPQLHGVCSSARPPAIRPFHLRLQDSGAIGSSLCMLWEDGLGFASPGYERSTFPGRNRNGERLMAMLRSSNEDLITFRMAGVANAAFEHGPGNDRVLRRLESMDKVLGVLFDRIRQRHAHMCLIGEFAVVATREVIRIDTTASRVILQGQVGHLWGCAPDAIERLRVHPGIAHVYTGSERDLIALNHDDAGDVVALARPHVGFEDRPGCAGIRHDHPHDQPVLLLSRSLTEAAPDPLKARIGVAEISWLLERAMMAPHAARG